MVKKHLQRDGFQIQHIGSGLEAIHAFQRTHFDLILLNRLAGTYKTLF